MRSSETKPILYALIVLTVIVLCFQKSTSAQHGGTVDPGRRPEKPPTSPNLPSLTFW